MKRQASQLKQFQPRIDNRPLFAFSHFGTSVEEESAISHEALAERLTATRDRRLFGAFDDDFLVGCIRLSRCEGTDGSNQAYIAGFYVVHEHRRKGCGRELISTVIGYARSEWEILRLNLSVVSGQHAEIALYRSIGFTEYGIEREVFTRKGQPFDEILMTLDLRKRS